MSSIDSGSMGAYVSSVASYNSQNMGKTGKADAASSSEKTSDIQKTSEAGKKSSVSGKTIGSPKLSEKAARYYEQLKSKGKVTKEKLKHRRGIIFFFHFKDSPKKEKSNYIFLNISFIFYRLLCIPLCVRHFFPQKDNSQKYSYLQ